MFNKNNFIVPVGIDKALKLRNKFNAIVYIIKDPSCTILINNDTLVIKQNAESNTFYLKFSSNAEALDAHLLLRNELILLNTNLNNNVTVNIQHVEFNPTSNSIINVDKTYNIPILMNVFISFYVNGIKINENWYTYDLSLSTITWLGIADYILETTDLLTIEYI